MLGLLAFQGMFCGAQTPPATTEPQCQARALPDYTASALMPGGATVYTLPQLISLAEVKNPDAKSAWENVQSAAAMLGIAKSALFPTLALSAYGLRGDTLFSLPSDIAGGALIQLNSKILEASLAASYSGDFGTNLNLYRAARHMLASQKASLNDTNQKVALDVSKKYYDYISDKASLQMSLANEDDSCLTLKNTEVEYRDGLTSIISLKSDRAKYLQARASTLNARAKQADGKIALAALIGLPAEQSFEVAPLADSPPVAVLAETVEALKEHALATSPQIAEDEEKINSAHDSVRAVRRKYLPTFSITAQGSYTDSTSGTNAESSTAAQAAASNTTGPTYLYLGSIKWNVFDAGQVRNEVKAAAASERQLRDKAEKTRLQLQEDVAKSYNDVLYAMLNEDAAAEAQSAAKDALDAATIAKSKGLASELDVSKANYAYASAQSSYVQARASLLEDATQLAYETGDLLSTGAESPLRVEVKHVP